MSAPGEHGLSTAAIDACMFDAYGTLFDVAAAAARERGALGDNAAPLAQIWRDKQLQYTWLRSLMGEYVDFWQVTGDALDYGLETLGIADPALRQRLMDLYLQLDAYLEVPSTLKRLTGAGLKCGILSNGAPKMLASAVGNAGIAGEMTAVLSVQDLGVYKPDRRVYQLAVDALGTAPERICFMSSNAWDVCGAAHFGFRVVWINRFGQAPERLPGTPVAILDSLEGLPALFGIA